MEDKLKKAIMELWNENVLRQSDEDFNKLYVDGYFQCLDDLMFLLSYSENDITGDLI